MKYEIMTIYKNDLGETGAKDLSNEIQKLVETLDGKVLENNFWGKRKFAYEINKSTEGFYDVLVIEMEASKINSFKNKLSLMSGVVRYLISAQHRAKEV